MYIKVPCCVIYNDLSWRWKMSSATFVPGVTGISWLMIVSAGCWFLWSIHAEQLLTISLIWAFIPGQYRCSLAQAMHFSIPKCPVWIFWITSLQSELGLLFVCLLGQVLWQMLAHPEWSYRAGWWIVFSLLRATPLLYSQWVLVAMSHSQWLPYMCWVCHLTLDNFLLLFVYRFSCQSQVFLSLYP